jgi:hypothetical protein
MLPMQNLSAKVGPATWGILTAVDTVRITRLYERVNSIAFLMTGDEGEASLIQVDVMSSAAMFVEMCEGPLGTGPMSWEMRERAVDRQLMIVLKRWIEFAPLNISISGAEDYPAPDVNGVGMDGEHIELRSALLQVPASERLMFILHWTMGFTYERCAVMFNLNDSLQAGDAAWNALRMVREKLRESSN